MTDTLDAVASAIREVSNRLDSDDDAAYALSLVAEQLAPSPPTAWTPAAPPTFAELAAGLANGQPAPLLPPVSFAEALVANEPQYRTSVRPDPKRDQWDRYLLPPLPGSNEDRLRGRQRASTVAKQLSSTEGLQRWTAALSALGVARSAQLRHEALMAGQPVPPEGQLVADLAEFVGRPWRDIRDDVRPFIDAAGTLGGVGKAAEAGTHMHFLTELYDLGLLAEWLDKGYIAPVDPVTASDLIAYQRAMNAAGITVDRDSIERIVVNDACGVAGMIDGRIILPAGFLFTFPPSFGTEPVDLLLPSGASVSIRPGYFTPLPEPLPVIGDKKTGQNAFFSQTEHALQQALYAFAEWWYDAVTESYTPAPWVSKQVAVILDLPLGQGVLDPEIIDVVRGYEAAQQSLWVGQWRKRRDLAITLPRITAEEPPTPPPTFAELPAIAIIEPEVAPEPVAAITDDEITMYFQQEMLAHRDAYGQWTYERLTGLLDASNGGGLAAGDDNLTALYATAARSLATWLTQVIESGKLPPLEAPRMAGVDLPMLDQVNAAINMLGKQLGLPFDSIIPPTPPTRDDIEARLRPTKMPLPDVPDTRPSAQVVDISRLASAPITAPAAVEPSTSTQPSEPAPATPAVEVTVPDDSMALAASYWDEISRLSGVGSDSDLGRFIGVAVEQALHGGLLNPGWYDEVKQYDVLTSNVREIDLGKWFAADGGLAGATRLAKELADKYKLPGRPKTGAEAAEHPIYAALLAQIARTRGVETKLTPRRAPRGSKSAPSPSTVAIEADEVEIAGDYDYVEPAVNGVVDFVPAATPVVDYAAFDAANGTNGTNGTGDHPALDTENMLAKLRARL